MFARAVGFLSHGLTFVWIARGAEEIRQPYDYVHFKGDNPKYREQMTPIDTRQLWERHIE